MSLSLQLHTLLVQAENVIETAVSRHGKETEASELAVDVSSLGITTISGERIIYASQCFLFDQHNERFNHDDLSVVSLFTLADYLSQLN